MNISNKWKDLSFEQIIDLYTSVGWQSYADDPKSLELAYKNSDYVVYALDEHDNLLGMARSISDNVSIHYLQDILVNPNFQKQGVGRALLNNVLTHFDHVKTHVLLTDDEERQHQFYKSLNYSNVGELKKTPLNVFIKMKDQNLE